MAGRGLESEKECHRENVVARQNAYCGMVFVVVMASAKRALFHLVRVVGIGRDD